MSGQGHPEPRVDGAARPGAEPHGARDAHAARPGRPERLRRARHLSIRARLTLTYAGMVTAAGVVLIALVYFYTRYVTLSIQIGDPVGELSLIHI